MSAGMIREHSTTRGRDRRVIRRVGRPVSAQVCRGFRVNKTRAPLLGRRGPFSAGFLENPPKIPPAECVLMPGQSMRYESIFSNGADGKRF